MSDDDPLTLYDGDTGAFSWDDFRATCEVTGTTLATGDIQFRADDDDLPTVTLASFETDELIAAAQDCADCTVVPAAEGYTQFCDAHRIEAALTALARGML